MNRWQIGERKRRLLKLLENPLTISILYLLMGVDPGRLSKEVLLKILSESWEIPHEDTIDQTDYGSY
ncbi:MAG: hypothetical protein ACFFBU_04420 [Promethearchaeota archaeon]